MRAFFVVALLALVACEDMRWDGQKTYGQLEQKREGVELEQEAVQLTSAQIETQSEATFVPFSPPKLQDEKTLWRLGRATSRSRVP
jgi:hypothetical protein